MRVLILGGCGAVGLSLLYQLQALGHTAVVVDGRKPYHREEHEAALKGTVEEWVWDNIDLQGLEDRLAEDDGFDVLVDLTPSLDKRRVLLCGDVAGVPVVNASMVSETDDCHIEAAAFMDHRPRASNHPHVAAAGMNPGAVQAMVAEIIGEDEPEEIVVWEYDDTMPKGGFKGPSITWSPNESGAEVTRDWTFAAIARNRLDLIKDPLASPLYPFKAVGVPMGEVPIPADAEGQLIGHEECIYLAWEYDCPARFIYGFKPENMDLIVDGGHGANPELMLRSRKEELIGRDIVGVAVRIGGKWRGQYCELKNSAEMPLDSNATCYLAAAGVMAALLILDSAPPKPGVYLIHELPDYLDAFREIADVQEYEAGAASRAPVPAKPKPEELVSATKPQRYASLKGGL